MKKKESTPHIMNPRTKRKFTADELAIATIRSLVVDMVTKPHTGHPGTAIGATPIMYALFKDHFVCDPHEPKWINRDRFVLSCGHASSVLYAMLHLCGYGITLNDLKNFRNDGSVTPAHPEFGLTKGIDASTGPLGQGVANAVGIAMAEAHLRSMFPNGQKIMNHFTYCLCGDGCLEEGISQEAITLAGLHKLNKLILIYDRNKITLDGKLSESNVENTELRFKAAGWKILKVADGENFKAISNAIKGAKNSLTKPTLIIVDTKIGFGTPYQGTNKIHGEPLDPRDAKATKEYYGFEHAPFTVFDQTYRLFTNSFVSRGTLAFNNYEAARKNYQNKYPKDYKRFQTFINENVIKENISDLKMDFGNEPIATRSSSGKVIERMATLFPNFIFGSADLGSSNKTKTKNMKTLIPNDLSGNYFQYGIREFGMGAISNGMLLHGGVRTLVSTFLVFADYLKASIRMAALMKLPNIYVFTHDSFFVGEDGPTHQPVEQLTMLRSIPNVNVIRPADGNETIAAYRYALECKDAPTVIVCSRQNLPMLSTSTKAFNSDGAYIIGKEKRHHDITILATGSEVALALEVKELIYKENKVDARVVSIENYRDFFNLPRKIRERLVGPRNKVVGIEAGSPISLLPFCWHVYGINNFGSSSSPDALKERLGFTPKKIQAYLKDLEMI